MSRLAAGISCTLHALHFARANYGQGALHGKMQMRARAHMYNGQYIIRRSVQRNDRGIVTNLVIIIINNLWRKNGRATIAPTKNKIREIFMQRLG